MSQAKNIGILSFHTKCFKEIAGDEYIIENIDHSTRPTTALWAAGTIKKEHQIIPEENQIRNLTMIFSILPISIVLLDMWAIYYYWDYFF